ncbi:MAG: creatininase family protein [Planctomycetota bacterium]
MASSRPAEEMLPHQIVAAAEESGCAFVPVGPMFEWHSYHLPPGTDALVAEGVCRLTAERVDGIWFRPLSFGLDAPRSPDQLRQWGIDPGAEVYGMRFPDVALSSEYAERPEMRAAVENRLFALRDSGFQRAFLVNHHGGSGQFETLQSVAEAACTPDFAVRSVRTYELNDLEEWIGVGGHAGLSETTWVLAFRPELVDLSRQPEGKLRVSRTGILHGEPTIEAEYNPRNASMAAAAELRQRVIENFVELVKRETSRR